VNSVHVTNEGALRLGILYSDACKLMLHQMTTWEMAATCSS